MRRVAEAIISRQHGADPWIIPHLAAMHEAGDAVLDLGCGPGEDTAELAARGFRVVGCDLSRKAIRTATEEVPIAHFFVADLRSPLPARTAVADVIVASLSLHYFPWQPTVALFGEIRRVLRPGGVFLFRVNATDDKNFGAGEGEELEPNYYHVPPDGRNNRPYKRFFDEPSLRALLAPDWQITHLAHRTIYRYGEAKQVWECCASL